MFGANDKASRCASVLLRSQEHEGRDYEMDGSGECGSMIARHWQANRIAILAEYGFTPESWSALLNERLGGGFKNHMLRMEIEVEPMNEWLDNNTFVCTLGYPGHPRPSTRRSRT